MKEREESQSRRRKKIVERGSDRMALITRRIRSPDRSPDPVSSAAHFGRIQSAPDSVYGAEADRFSEDQEYDRAPRTLLHGKNEASRLSLNYDSTNGVRTDVFGLGDRISSLQNIKANAEGAQDSVAPFHCEVKPPAVDARIAEASNEAQTFLKASCSQLISYFTPKDINSCIVSSENTRVFCSIMIALLVVIAYANLPRHVVRSKSTIASRPLYVLLVTDLMIVMLRLHFIKQNLTKMAAEKPESRQGDGNNWDEAVKVLEWGLVLYQTIRALFIDCSFYTVIVVCGFSLI